MCLRHAVKRSRHTGGEKFHCFKNVRDDDVHINGDARIAVFLHRQSTDNQMWYVMVRQYRHSVASRLHDAGSPGILA